MSMIIIIPCRFSPFLLSHSFVVFRGWQHEECVIATARGHDRHVSAACMKQATNKVEREEDKNIMVKEARRKASQGKSRRCKDKMNERLWLEQE